MCAKRLATLALVVVAAAPALASRAGVGGGSSATISFDTASGVAESIESAVPTSPDFQPGGLFYSFCWPPMAGEVPQAGETTVGEFTVGLDGALSGTCTVNRSANDTTIQRTSTISGQYDRAAQTVAFHLEGTQSQVVVSEVRQGELERYSDTESLVVDAAQVPVVDGVATGRAQFTWALVASENFSPSLTKVTGTIGFALTLGVDEAVPPVVVPGGAAPPGGGEPASSGTDVTGGGILTRGGGSGVSAAGLAALGAIVVGVAGAAILQERRQRARGLASPPADQIASVTADQFGGLEDSYSLGEASGQAAPAHPRAYEALVVSQTLPTTRRPPFVTSSRREADARHEDERRGASDGNAPGARSGRRRDEDVR